MVYMIQPDLQHARGHDIFLSAQQSAKVATKCVTPLYFVNNEDLIILQNTPDTQKFSVEQIVRKPLYSCGALYVITRMVWFSVIYSCCGLMCLSFTQSGLHHPVHHRAWKIPPKGHSCALPSFSFPMVNIQIVSFFCPQ